MCIRDRYQTDEVDLFSDEDMDGNVQPISREDYERLLDYLQKKNPAAILPIPVSYTHLTPQKRVVGIPTTQTLSRPFV